MPIAAVKIAARWQFRVETFTAAILELGLAG